MPSGTTDSLSGKQIANRTLALAGVVQAAQLADRLANTGEAPESSIASSVGSLFVFNPANTEEVFGGAKGIKLGLRTLCAIADQGLQHYAPAIRYARGMIRLESDLGREESMGTILHHRLAALHEDNSGEEEVDSICAGLNDVYKDTLSTLTFRIRLRGNRRHLAESIVVHRLRALMLAGVRSAMLWRQMGGGYLRLLMEHRQMTAIARRWLEQNDADSSAS